jgi:hypothetical protein
MYPLTLKSNARIGLSPNSIATEFMHALTINITANAKFLYGFARTNYQLFTFLCTAEHNKSIQIVIDVINHRLEVYTKETKKQNVLSKSGLLTEYQYTTGTNEVYFTLIQ